MDTLSYIKENEVRSEEGQVCLTRGKTSQVLSLVYCTEGKQALSLSPT